MSTPETSSAQPDRGEIAGISRVRLVLLFVVVVLLAGAVIWHGTSEGTFRVEGTIHLRRGLSPDEKMTAYVDSRDMPKALRMYAELTGRALIPSQASWSQRLDQHLNGRLTRWRLVKSTPLPDSGICYHRDGRFSAIEIKQSLEDLFLSVGFYPVPEGRDCFRLVRRSFVADTRD
jgi:hypothetical protein